MLCSRDVDRYFDDVRARPQLTPDEEETLLRDYYQTRCPQTERRLLEGNLRFVAKIAHEYNGYNLPLPDLIQEGNIGLLIAIRKFDPRFNRRLACYAIWWIRAYICTYVLRNWSLVKLGTTAAQRKLFFRLRSVRSQLGKDRPAVPVTNAELARHLNVKEVEVFDMSMRLSMRDTSIDMPLPGCKNTYFRDLLPGHHDSADEIVEYKDDHLRLRKAVAQEMGRFNTKERFVLEHRMLCDSPQTLEEIGNALDLSRERVRQIECGVVGKLRDAMRSGRSASFCLT